MGFSRTRKKIGVGYFLIFFPKKFFVMGFSKTNIIMKNIIISRIHINNNNKKTQTKEFPPVNHSTKKTTQREKQKNDYYER